MEEYYKSSWEAQRSLNLPMMEVVKKEILKLLNARMIYHVSERKWLIPVQVVQKKTCIIVTKNDQGELVATHCKMSGKFA